MFTATRHAQRLAGNFLDDVDDFQRASRAADRRAMSHFEDAAGSSYLFRPRRSYSVSRYTLDPLDYYYEGSRSRALSAEPHYGSTYASSLHPVTVVGSRYSHYTPSIPYSRYGSGNYHAYGGYYPHSSYSYWPYTSSTAYSHHLPSTNYYTRSHVAAAAATPYAYDLPTSGLKASVPSWDYGYRPLSQSRWYSHSNLVDPLVMLPAVPLEISPYIRYPRARYGSVPPVTPAALAHYRRPESRSRVRVPSVPPPIRQLTTHYVSDLTGPMPITSKYAHHGLSPHVSTTPIHSRRFYVHPNVPRDNFEQAMCQEVLAERRRIGRKMDDLLSYKLPDASIYNDLKSSLRKVHDTMDKHRTLLDRYSALDMHDTSTVEDRVASKYRELGERLAR